MNHKEKGSKRDEGRWGGWRCGSGEEGASKNLGLSISVSRSRSDSSFSLSVYRRVCRSTCLLHVISLCLTDCLSLYICISLMLASLFCFTFFVCLSCLPPLLFSFLHCLSLCPLFAMHVCVLFLGLDYVSFSVDLSSLFTFPVWRDAVQRNVEGTL